MQTIKCSHKTFEVNILIGWRGEKSKAAVLQLVQAAVLLTLEWILKNERLS